VAGVHHFACDLAAQCSFRQTGTDGSGHFGHGDGAWKLALGAVGERDVNHGKECFA